MTALFAGSLGHFISLLNVYKRLWRDKTEEASVWFSHDQEPPSCLEWGAFRLVSEEWGQAKLDCLSISEEISSGSGGSQSLQEHCAGGVWQHPLQPHAIFFYHSQTGLFQGLLIHSWLHWPCSCVQSVTVVNMLCSRKSHWFWKYQLCFFAILFNSCSFYFTSAWISGFQATKMIYLMPAHAVLQSNRF